MNLKDMKSPVVFLIFMIVAFIFVDYFKIEIKNLFPGIPNIVIIAIGFGIIIVLLTLFGIKMPGLGK
jgi:hypothetical protein